MKCVESQWHVRLNFNTVHIMGIAPTISETFDPIIEGLLVNKAAYDISIAEKLGECLVSQSIHEDLQEMMDRNSKNNTIMVAFSVAFRDFSNAEEYVRILREG